MAHNPTSVEWAIGTVYDGDLLTHVGARSYDGRDWSRVTVYTVKHKLEFSRVPGSGAPEWLLESIGPTPFAPVPKD